MIKFDDATCDWLESYMKYQIDRFSQQTFYPIVKQTELELNLIMKEIDKQDKVLAALHKKLNICRWCLLILFVLIVISLFI